MSTSIRRLIVAILILQQASFGLPASAENIQAGKPLDAGALSDSRTSGGNEEVGANLFTGDATFRVPFVAPPGTGGFTPRVALAYSSGATQTNGPVGVGWSLDIGSAMIERSTRDGAPRYDDTQDTFALGGHDLVETGTAGRFVSENHDFQRIDRLTGQGDYWRVLRTDGTRLYYGFAYDPAPANPPNDSRLYSAPVNAFEGTPNACPSGYWVFCFARENIIPSGIPFAWYLDRMEDRNGNVIHFRWESRGDPGARYLAEIRYSGHVGGGVNAVPDFAGNDDNSLSRVRTVTFDYDTLRTDELPSYRTGFQRQISQRLTDVTVEVDGQLVRHYVLEYEQSPASGRSRLTFVRDRGADDSAATEYVHSFTYGSGGTAGWSAKVPAYALPAGLSFVSGGQDAGIRLVDVNNDAYPDVVHANSGTRNTYLGGPNGFNGSVSSTWESPGNIVSGSNDQYRGVTFADFDGDGRPDFIRRQLNVTGTNQVSGTPCGTRTYLEKVHFVG